MRVILLTRDSRHYVLKWPAYAVGDEMLGQLAAGGEVRVPVDNYAAQESYNDDQIEYFHIRLQQVEEECAAARAADPGLIKHYERADRLSREAS